MIVWWMLLMLLGCRSEEPAVRGTIARTPAVEMYRQASDALREAGIEKLTWGVTPYVTASGEIEDRYRPMVNMVSERVSTPMEVIAGESYQDVETLLLSGQIDIAVAVARRHCKGSGEREAGKMVLLEQAARTHHT